MLSKKELKMSLIEHTTNIEENAEFILTTINELYHYATEEPEKEDCIEILLNHLYDTINDLQRNVDKWDETECKLNIDV